MEPLRAAAPFGFGWRGAALAVLAAALLAPGPGADAQDTANDNSPYFIESVYYRSPEQTECTRGYPNIDVVLAIDASARASPQVSLRV